MYSLGFAAALQGPPMLPIDITSIVAITLGSMVVLIPIAGATARFALKPIAEAVAKMREGQGAQREVQVMDQRVALLEQQLSNLESEMQQLTEAAEFDRQLAAGPTEE